MLRTGLAAILLVIFLPAVVAANTSTWALRTVLDSDAFAATTERALETPELESLIATRTAEAIVASAARRAPEELRVLAVQGLGLEPDAARAQVSAALATRLQGVFASPAVRDAREEVIASLHGYLLRTAEGTPGLITVQGDEVVLDPRDLVDRIVESVDPSIAAQVQASSALDDLEPVVIAEVDALEPVRQALDVMQALQVIVPLVALAVALLIVVVAHRRERALGIVGAAVALAGAASLLVLWVAGAYVTRLPTEPVARTISAQVYDAFVVVLRDQAIVLVVAGVAILIVALILGRRARRKAVRRMLGPRTGNPPAGVAGPLG
jgi:hypothetical protein